MSGGQDRNEVVLGRSDGAFRRVGPMVLGSDMLERDRGDCWRKKAVGRQMSRYRELGE